MFWCNLTYPHALVLSVCLRGEIVRKKNVQPHHSKSHRRVGRAPMPAVEHMVHSLPIRPRRLVSVGKQAKNSRAIEDHKVVSAATKRERGGRARTIRRVDSFFTSLKVLNPLVAAWLFEPRPSNSFLDYPLRFVGGLSRIGHTVTCVGGKCVLYALLLLLFFPPHLLLA